MENWIGIGVWIVMGAVVGLIMRGVVDRDETPGHVPVLMALGAFGAVIGGMLGVGIFEFDEPVALSAGGMGGALALSALMAFIYRWGVKGLI
jgi:uncharacterized membrane protein YeaQ/YmgE (transglycosylase-associated protein family)